VSLGSINRASARAYLRPLPQQSKSAHFFALSPNSRPDTERRRKPELRRRLESAIAADAPIGIPTIVLFELRYGIARSARPQENAAILAASLTLDVSPWPFELEDAEEAGDIRAELERAGTPIGPCDVLIAAQARRRGALLVTANSGEFTRIPG
jgi:tRNA(fMet)-specific endonuclease VapC